MPTITEKELEDYLFDWSPNSPYEEEEGHPLGIDHGNIFRQVNIKGYGVIDLLSVKIECEGELIPSIIIDIIELKKGVIDYNALGQISRYKVALEKFISELREEKGFKYFKNLEIRGILVGDNINLNGDLCYAIQSIPWLSLYTYDIGLREGISFELSYGWSNNDENFSDLYRRIKDDFIRPYIAEYTSLPLGYRLGLKKRG